MNSAHLPSRVGFLERPPARGTGAGCNTTSRPPLRLDVVVRPLRLVQRTLVPLLLAACVDDSRTVSATTGDAPAITAEHDTDKTTADDATARTRDSTTPVLTPEARQAALRALLGVMEPDARGFVLVATPLPWSADAVAETFALPEDARELLDLANDVEWALAQRYGDDAPRRLFAKSPWLVFRPSIVGEPILVRYAPASPQAAGASDSAQGGAEDDTEATTSTGRAFFRRVMAQDFDERRVTGTDLFDPKARFPWRVVWLADDVVAFVSTRELGTGTSPLTAGRDLPFTGIRGDLERELGDEAIVMLLATGGPSMHLQLPEWVLRTRLRVTKWQDGHDVEVGLELPSVEAADAAARALDEGSTLDGVPIPDTLVELHRTVAFTSQATVVEGRLQLTPELAAPLRDGTNVASAPGSSEANTP